MTTFEVRSWLAPATGDCRQQIEKLLAYCAELESQSVAVRELPERTPEGFIVKRPRGPGAIGPDNPLTPGCYCQPGKCGAPKPEWCRDAAKRDFLHVACNKQEG